MKQLLQAKQFGKAYTVIIGARDVERTLRTYATVTYDNLRHRITVLPLELVSLPSVQEFAEKAMAEVRERQVDYLFLNAGMSAEAGPSSCNSKWCDTQVVNQLCE